MFQRRALFAVVALSLVALAACTPTEPIADAGWSPDARDTTPTPETGPDDTDPDASPDSGGWTDRLVRSATSQQIDLLWVIDNSQSMCQEQRALRDGFDTFVETLRRNPVDFHIGVTTTQYDDFIFEPVAEPGRLQSTPHPPVGFSDSCRFGSNNQGELLTPEHPDGPNYEPLRRQIEDAIACTKNPSQFDDLHDWTDDEITCALVGNKSGACDAAGKDESTFTAEKLFPCANKLGQRCDQAKLEQVYRDIPKVLKASDYERDDGTLRLDELRRDFACMSFVGTRGSSNEQGLQAAAKALSPDMTGGTVENPTNPGAPNHGLLREDARTATIFMTDENDCSHEGDAVTQATKQNRCGELNCYFPTKEGSESDLLLETDELADRYKENLRQSKGLEDFPSDDSFVASFHGTPRRYNQSIPKDSSGDIQCQSGDMLSLTDKLTVCDTELGSAKSGGRYGRFLEEFDNIYPRRDPVDPDEPIEGLMCKPDSFDTSLRAMAGGVQPEATICFGTDLPRCPSSGDCPAYTFGAGSSPTCRPLGTSSERSFCDSQVRVIAESAPADSEAHLKPGFCIEESKGTEIAGDGCVVERSAYELVPCPGNESGALELEWNSDVIANPTRQLAGIELTISYRTE